MSEPQPLPLGHGGTSRDVQYHAYTCSSCETETRNTYCEPHRTRMLERRLCFTCDHWRNFAETQKPEELTVIDSIRYGPGNRTSGEFRGMGGRRFDIEYVEPSVYAGQRITTFDLWAGGKLPEHLHKKFPDTARFLGGAESVLVGETRCFNPSDRKGEVYPLPLSLKRTCP